MRNLDWCTKIASAVLLGLGTAVLASAQTFETLASFDKTDGAYPWTGALTQGIDGNYYGTTTQYGANYGGTIFKISAEGTLTTLYNFCQDTPSCLDGNYPEGGLALAANGNLYGTTNMGGAYGYGSVFEITPTGTFSTVYSFCAFGHPPCPDGSGPEGTLVLGANGSFYGTTYWGGTDSGPSGLGGTVFEITPGGQLTTLYDFCSQPNCTDGGSPSGGLVQGTDGNFYGTTYEGGDTGVFQGGNGCSVPGFGPDYLGCGTVFKITPQGEFTSLYTFCRQASCPDGAFPSEGGALVQAANGNFYGTTNQGGANVVCDLLDVNYSCGTVFEITPEGTLTTLHSFCSENPPACDDGFFPIGMLTLGSDGNLYGTTSGNNDGNPGPATYGTIFEITPSGTLTTLHDFCEQNGCPDGAGPIAAPAQGTNGTFYGTTEGGGVGDGTVFSLSAGLGPFVETVPTSGATGAAVTILGNNLAGSTSVKFSGTAATFTVVSSTEITATVPTGATTGTVQVVTPGGTLNSNVPFQVVIPLLGASLSPSSLVFAPQLLQTTSAAQAVSLNNVGSQALSITGITSSGDFAQTNNCGSSVAAGASCTINVTFTPTQGGGLTGAISVTDNAPGSPQTVSLTGTGAVGSRLAKSPTLTVDFCGRGEGEPAIWRPSNATWYVYSASGCSGDLTQVQGQTGDVPVSADYDGDGKSDFAVWQPSNGSWFIIPSSNPSAAATVVWGLPGDVPVPADYDGDGVSDVAVWRPSTGTWYILPSDGGGSITKQWGQAGDVPVIGDYDGDGKADYAVFRPSNYTWYVILSSTGQMVQTAWGLPGDMPVEGDYDGDGKTDYAVWRPSTATWWILLSSGTIVQQQWGETGDIPVVGDYNGDGKNDYEVWRPSNATWYVTYSSGGQLITQWGEIGDIPATHLPSMIRRDKHIANFDGDRKTDLGVWRPSTATWWVIDSSTGKLTSQEQGENGDMVVPGDYDGDGKTDYAVWQPSNGTWYVILSSTGKSVTESWGLSADIPVPGDYDGDGKTDYAVWRPSTQTWWIILSSTGKEVSQLWGASGDIPVPADYDGDGKTDYAIWRPSTGTWWVILSSTGKEVSQLYGMTGDIPVPGDYDGDTKADYSIFRPSAGMWYTLESSTGKSVSTVFGQSGDIPVAKDYDGDEKTDIAIWRPSNATWYILQSSTGTMTITQWGESTDVPVNQPTGQY